MKMSIDIGSKDVTSSKELFIIVVDLIHIRLFTFNSINKI